MKVFFFFILFFSFTITKAQTLITDAEVPVLDACGDYQQFLVSIVKGSPDCNNGNLKIELPSGFEIQNGSIKLNGEAKQVSIVPGQPVNVNITFPSGPITQEVKVTYNVKALCEIIGNTSIIPTVNYTFTGCNKNLVGSSDAINTRYAVLRVKVTPDNYLGNINDAVNRTIEITNQGNGAISEFTVERTLGEGLGNQSNPYDVSAAVAAGWIVDFSNPNKIKFSGKKLNTGEKVTIIEKINIIDCELTPTSYEVYYGCTIKCTSNNVNGETTNVVNLAPIKEPKLQVTSSVPNIICFNTFVKNIWTVKNTGEISSNAFVFEINALSEINISNGAILVNGSPVNVLNNSSVNSAKISLPALAVGQSITIEFEQKYIAPDVSLANCENGTEMFSTGKNSYSAKLSFSGSCNDVTNSGTVKEDTTYKFAGQHVGEVDIFSDSPFNVDYLFHNFSIPKEQLNVGDKFAVTIDLSNGLSLSDFNFKGIDVVSIGNNRYELVFTYGSAPWNEGSDLEYIFPRLQFPITLNCDVADLSDLWYKVGGELRKQDLNCQPVVFKCNVTKLKGFCGNGPCPDGLVNDKAELKRLTVGHSVDQNGKPSLTSDSTNGELRNFITGDVLEISQKSKSNVTSQVFSKVKFEVEKDETGSNATLIENSGKVIIDGVTIASNINVTETANSFVLEYALPAAVVDGQSIVLSLTLKVGESNLGLKQFPVKSYLVSANGDEMLCGRTYTATGLYVPVQFSFEDGSNDFVECTNETNKVTFKAKIIEFSNQDSFFFNEYRKIFAPTTATINVSENLIMTGVKVVVKNQPWLGINNSTTINGLNINNANYELNLASAIKKITALTLGADNGIDYLDEGFELEIYPIVALSACEPAATSKEQVFNVTLKGIILDGKTPQTIFEATKQLKYNTGFGTLTMKTSNDSKIGKFSADGKEVSWVVKVESEGSRNFNSVWFAKNNGVLAIKSVQEVTNYSGEITLNQVSPVNEIYKLGDFDSRTPKYYLIKSDIIDCTLEELILTGGYNCETNVYPTSINSATCKINEVTLQHSRIVDIIQTEIYDQFNGSNVKPNLCEDIWYTVQLHNGGDSKLDNLKITIPLNTAPGLAFEKFEVGNVYNATATVPTSYTSVGTSSVVDDVLTITLPSNTSLNTLQRIRVKVYFKINSCDFRSGSRHTVDSEGKNICSAKISSQSNPTTKRLIIEGGSDAFPELRLVPGSTNLTIDPVLSSGSILRANYSTSILNSGEFDINDAITTDYKVAIKLPSGWSIVGDPNEYLQPSAKVEFVSLDAERGYVYKVTSNINVNEQIKFNNVPLKYTLSDETNLECNFNFGNINISVYQNIAVNSCLPGVDCSLKGIDQVLYEDTNPMILPIVSALSIEPASQAPVICAPTVNGVAPTLADIVLDEATNVFHLDWYENEQEALSDLPVNRLAANTPLVNGRTYYVINRFVYNGLCKSNIGKIKVTFKENNLSGTVTTECNDSNNTYQVKVVLNGTGTYTVSGTGAPGIFNGNVWTSSPISSATPFGSGANYSITFTNSNNCSPYVVSGQAPVCCTLEVTAPLERIVNCGNSVEPAVTGLPTINKSCGLTSFTYTDSEVTNCINGFKSFTRTFTITDSKGNVKSVTQVIKLKDDVKPVFNGSLPVNVTVSCASEVPAAVTLTATDNCGIANVEFNEQLSAQTCVNKYVLTRTWIATDLCGNTTTHKQVITVNDNIKPVFVGNLPTNVTVSCASEVPVAVTLTATDNCGIANVEFNEQLSAQTCVNKYVLTRTWTATDLCGNTTTHKQVITVNDNIKPTFVGNLPTNVTVSCASEVPTAAILTATDNCGEATVSFNDIVEKEDGSCANNYVIKRTYTATDLCGNSTSHLQIITVNDTIKPQFVENLPGNITVSCSSEIPTARTLTAKDNCGDAIVTFDQVKVDGSCEGNFKWIRTWTAKDECGNTTTHTQTVSVEDKTAPVFTVNPSNKVVECDGQGNVAEFTEWLHSYAGAIATDNCSDVTMTYYIEDTNTICGFTGDIIVSFIATDACGNSAIKQAVFLIKDTVPPVFVQEAKPITVECGANEDALNAWLATNGGAIAQDICSSDVTWTNNFREISKQCGNTGTADVTFTATDACGNQSTTIARFTIVDTKAPVIIQQAKNTIISCDSNTDNALQNWLATNGGASATDACSDITWTNNFTQLITINGNVKTAEVIFTVKDQCGNESSTTASFTIEDKIAPVILTPAKNKIVECSTDNILALNQWLASNGGATATDSCSDVTWSNNFTELSDLCGETGNAEVTFTATDASGNSTSTTATFTIVDTKAPVFIVAPENKIVECDGLGNEVQFNAWLTSFANAQAQDSCSEVTFSYTIQSSSAVTCGKSKDVIVNFIATDACGNASSKQATFSIKDTTAPTIVTPANDKEVECNGNGNLTDLNAWLATNGGATASDLCGNVSWTNNFTELTNLCGSKATATVVFTATDACGNASSTTATFTINDTKAPIIVTPAQSLTVSCESNTEQALTNWLNTRGGASASDLCSSVTWSNNFTGLTSACGSTGSAEVIFTATDDCGNVVSTTATFTIEDRVAPVITTQAKNKIVESDGNGNEQELEDWLRENANAVATDSCSVIYWTNDFDSLTQSCGSTGSAEVTFTAFDACGNSVSTRATFTIIDTIAPELITSAEDVVVECDGEGNQDELNNWISNNGNARVTEDDSKVNWTYTISSVQTNNNAKVHTIDFEVADLCGNRTLSRATFTILDTTAPEITIPAENKIVECDGNGNTNDLNAWLNSFAGAQADDLCGTITWSNNFTGLTNTCGATGNAEVIFTVTDQSGNSSSTTATFTIVDTTAPTFESNLPQDLVLECNMEIPQPELVRAVDSCSSATVTFNEVKNEGSCAGNYEIVRTWTATDACGNSTTHIQTIQIQDTTAPEFVGNLPASEVFMNCKDLKNAEVLTAIDNCGSVTVTSFDEKVETGCDAKYDILRTWVATDSCGNETSFVQTIHLSCAIDVYNAVTADGDGNNDELIIKGIDCYPGNSVEIFNRWGVLVYETKNYNSNGNTFKGYSEGRATISKGSKLPTGTYFYVIKYTYDLGNGQTNPIEQSGYLHLETN